MAGSETAGSGYVYDQGWAEERARLAGIEALWDDGTKALLAAEGAGPGARVLEVGAGGGSIVEWLAGVVGSAGHVLAVDLDTRFVDALASDVVEVRQADVVTAELPQGEFDVVHARLLLEHLPARDDVLRRLAETVKPGGRLVIEDYDWSSFGFDPNDDTEERVTEGILRFMADAGFVADYGRQLVSSMVDAGLVEVRGEGRSRVIDSSHPGYAFFRLSLEQLAPAAIQAGRLDAADAEQAKERLATDAYRIITPTLMAGIASRRP